MHRELWLERDPRVPPHRRIDAGGRPTIRDLEDWIRHLQPRGSLGLLVVERKSTGRMIGYCGLIENEHGPADEPELAFELLRATWGRGFATEASQAVIAGARSAGCTRLWASVRQWNHASRRVLEKLGFLETGRVEPDPVHGDSLFTSRRL